METTCIDFGPSDSDKLGRGDIPDTEIQPRLVIAIDFGMYACGIALQWRSGYEENWLESIKVTARWAGTGFCTRKTPSCLLLKPDRSFAEFGYRADFMFSKNESIPEKKRPADWNDWYFFRFFKAMLYAGQDLSLDTPVKAANGKHLPIVDVLAKTLAYLKMEAISVLNVDGVVYPEEKTKWVITVPAIWNDSAKHVMHEAAERAGIPSNNLMMALKSECAVIYCSKLPLDKIEIHNTTDDTENTTDKKKTRSVAFPGQIITVVDTEGAEVYFTNVKINQDNSIRQVTNSCNGPFGLTKVNEKFKMYLQDLIGTETMRTFVEKHAIDYHDLQMDFDSKQREFTGMNDCWVPIKLPELLLQLWENAEEKSVDEILESKARMEVEFEAGRLFLRPEIMQSFFQDSIDEIFKMLTEKVLTDPNLKGVPVSSILLVGDLAESHFLVETLWTKIKEKHISVLRPQDQELAVLYGAVLFGHNEKIVSSRITRNTHEFSGERCAASTSTDNLLLPVQRQPTLSESKQQEHGTQRIRWKGKSTGRSRPLNDGERKLKKEDCNTEDSKSSNENENTRGYNLGPVGGNIHGPSGCTCAASTSTDDLSLPVQRQPTLSDGMHFGDITQRNNSKNNNNWESTVVQHAESRNDKNPPVFDINKYAGGLQEALLRTQQENLWLNEKVNDLELKIKHLQHSESKQQEHATEQIRWKGKSTGRSSPLNDGERKLKKKTVKLKTRTREVTTLERSEK